jgi:RNA polymerase sigma factor (sigma-70 family)
MDQGLFNKKGEPVKALGYYHLDLGRVKSLESIEQEKELLERYKKNRDPEAKRLICEAHLLMVVRMANKYAVLRKRAEVEDLIGRGNIGLLRALEATLKVDLEFRFVSFAKKFVKREMFDELYRSFQSFSVPPSIQRTIIRLKRNFPQMIWSEANEEAVLKIADDFAEETLKAYYSKNEKDPSPQYEAIIRANAKWNVQYACNSFSDDEYRQGGITFRHDLKELIGVRISFGFEVDVDASVIENKVPFALGNRHCINRFASPEEAAYAASLLEIVTTFLSDMPEIESEMLRRYLIKDEDPCDIAKDFKAFNGDQISRKIWKWINRLREEVFLNQKSLEIESIEKIIEMFESSKEDSAVYVRNRFVMKEIERRLKVDETMPMKNEDLHKLVKFKAHVPYQNHDMTRLLKIAEVRFNQRMAKEGFKSIQE